MFPSSMHQRFIRLILSQAYVKMVDAITLPMTLIKRSISMTIIPPSWPKISIPLTNLLSSARMESTLSTLPLYTGLLRYAINVS